MKIHPIEISTGEVIGSVDCYCAIIGSAFVNDAEYARISWYDGAKKKNAYFDLSKFRLEIIT